MEIYYIYCVFNRVDSGCGFKEYEGVIKYIRDNIDALGLNEEIENRLENLSDKDLMKEDFIDEFYNIFSINVS